VGPVNLIDLSAPIRPDPPDYPEPLAERVKESGQPGDFWAAHQANLAYSQIERLVILGALPPDGFQVACFPLRIEGAGAAPARVVAIVPEGAR
jgi:kynurenine formamidase